MPCEEHGNTQYPNSNLTRGRQQYDTGVVAVFRVPLVMASDEVVAVVRYQHERPFRRIAQLLTVRRTEHAFVPCNDGNYSTSAEGDRDRRVHTFIKIGTGRDYSSADHGSTG